MTQIDRGGQAELEGVRSVFAASPLPMAALDTGGRIMLWNAAAERVFGWTPDEVIGSSLPFVAESARVHCAAWRRAVMSGDITVNCQAHPTRRDGTRLDMIYSGSPLRTSHGDVLGMVMVMEDMTELNRATRERDRLFEMSYDLMCIVGFDRQFRQINPAFERALGYSCEELRHHNALWYIHPDDRRETRLALRALSRGVDNVTIENRYRSAGGSYRWLAWTVNVSHEDGAYYAVARDVTERKNLDEQYATLARQKDDFLAGATHDLKTPLTTIRVMTQFLQQQARASALDAERLSRGLERIDSTVTRMTAAINGLLDVTRVDMGRPLDLWLREVDLVSLVGRLVAESSNRTVGRNIEFRTDLPALQGQFDAFRLERALDNLLSNAIKYSAQHSTIEVQVGATVRDGQRIAVLSVRDQGIGIPSEDLPHIFSRFYRAANVVGRIPGQGIGLVGVRRTVEEHGGEVAIESVEGEGTTVTISLPVFRDVVSS